ncbi:hypothetical protein SZ54_3070 [Rhizobium sp. UR51a]|nr:hypothetical protein SZ54_3070 [Rhizobium sp. UR51a]
MTFYGLCDLPFAAPSSPEKGRSKWDRTAGFSDLFAMA